ncbi:glycosyl hydrolase family 61-domain-containing protein [Penicillium waksmanii]|uniref:glycosyl hydrolase family 61-domain-containing protein n=1 Tax=Penicillium waksmanii TaxID=69791 RepID=UPI002546A486|nr:glycosyl hydrolase family 61-domain-containing protein [Penicillium waksmanii]KAJ5975471.1 glycosyl hydrolase family 61-domain-containing protein [Penicillium waksmanii]
MSLSKTAGLLLASAALVAGHGYVTSIDVDGTTYGGYLIDTYYYESDPPEIIAWSTTATDDGFVAPSAYDSSDIVCHRGSAPAALSAPVAPGGSVKMTWSTWPDDHHGPVITYLAKCDGDCADVDKTTLEFFKIDAGGLISETAIPGTWASDKLIEDSFSRTMTIPSDIEAGNYVLRHEIIALHSAENTDGAQNYPQCINLNVTGSGTASPSGTLGTALYKASDPGIFVDIWNTLSTYDIPGPTLYTAGGAATATAAAATSTSTSTEAAAAVETTTAAAATAAAVTSVAASSPSDPTESVPQVVAVASSPSTASTSASTSTSGVLSGSCNQEGYWYCNGGSAFQRCVNGEWDASQSVAEGTQCTAGISEDLTISTTVQRRQASHLRRHNARIDHVY